MNLRELYERIERRLDATHQTSSSASLSAGLSKDAIRNIKRALDSPDRKGVSTRTIDCLAEALRTTPEWLLRGIGPELSDLTVRVQYAPLLSWVQAGKITRYDVATIEDAERIPLTNLPVSDYTVLNVKGDSMDRVAPEDSMIVVDTRARDPLSRQFFVFVFDDGATTFKRFMDSPFRLEPYSTNPQHETIYPNIPYDTVGRVRRVIKDL